jgi:hypothetical protein
VLLEGGFLSSAEDLRWGFRWEVGGEVRLVDGDCLMGGEGAAGGGGGGVSVSRGSSSSGGRGSICMASVSAPFSFSGTSGEGGR